MALSTDDIGQCDGGQKMAGSGLQLAYYWQEGWRECVDWIRSSEVAR